MSRARTSAATESTPRQYPLLSRTSSSTGRAILLTLIAAQFVVMLDSSILNVAIPSIAADLELTPVGSAWMLNAYFLSFGGLLLVSGRAADVFGRRRMFLLGSLVLVAGSVLGGLASTEGVLMLARLIQGSGAALLSPAAMSVVLARFTGTARAAAMSGWGAASAVGGAAGVSVGGLLTAAYGWQSVLFVTGATGILIFAAAWFVLPLDTRVLRRRFDVPGAALVTGSAVATVFGVLSAPQHGLASLPVLAAFAVAGASLVGFVMVERRTVDPVLPLQAFRDARVAWGVVVNLLGGAARVAVFVFVALVLQQVLEYGPAIAGVAMLPTSLFGFAVSVFALPALLNRLRPERVAAFGLVLLAVAHLMLSRIDNGDPYLLAVLPALMMAAAGVAFSFTPTTLVIADGMAARNAGVSSGLASSTAQIGGALGIAVFGAIDAANRASALHGGDSSLVAAEAGLSAAHMTAAAVAGVAAVVALLAFPRPT
ncbi:MFS transporter [Microcella sp.]|uniref:MFS transporter n=1 Tax=Microcella sp. TaxID=1913979 RepID=UPI00391BDDA3